MLRIGIMCRGDVFHAWEASVIQSLFKYDDISIELLILEEPKPKSYLSWIKKISWKHILWQIFFRISSRAMPCDFKVDMASELSDIDRVSCKPTLKGKYSQYFKPSDVDFIQSYNLDVILRFGFNIIRGDILAAAKYGVWSYHHGDNTRYRGMPSGFWEIYSGDTITGSVLQQLTDVLDGGRILKRGFFATIRHSYAQNRNMIHQASSIWVSKLCRDILDGNKISIAITDSSDKHGISGKTAPIYGLPSNLQMIRFISLQILYQVKRRIMNALSRPSWTIGILRSSNEELFHRSELDNVRWIPRPKGSFMADPFLIKAKSTYHVFFEEYVFSRFRGRISVASSKDLLTFSEPKVVLDKSFHLSYPYVFQHEDQYYLLPEQAESGKIVLYVSYGFPHKWRQIVTVANFPGLDPTILFSDGRWWLFAGRDSKNGAENAELFLWSSEGLSGPWIPHPQNPIKTDIKSSRPGGRPFLRNGKWIRPAQDCSVTYGGQLVFNEIIHMTEKYYEERTIHALKPSGESQGMHTLDFHGKVCVVDNLDLDKSLPYFLNYCKNKIFYKRK